LEDNSIVSPLNEVTGESSETSSKSPEVAVDPILHAWGDLLQASLQSSSTHQPSSLEEEDSTFNIVTSEATADSTVISFADELNLTTWGSSYTTDTSLVGENLTMISLNDIGKEEDTSSSSEHIKIVVDPFLESWGDLLHASLQSSTTLPPSFRYDNETTLQNLVTEEHTLINTEVDFSTENMVKEAQSTVDPKDSDNRTEELDSLLSNLDNFLNSHGGTEDHFKRPVDKMQRPKPTTNDSNSQLGVWGSLLHAFWKSGSSKISQPPPLLSRPGDKSVGSMIYSFFRQQTNSPKIWYQSDQNCQGLEPGKEKVLYSQAEPSTLCAGQSESSWLCYCSGRLAGKHALQYCGNCSATFIPTEINGTPLRNRASGNHPNKLVSEEKEANDSPKSSMNLLAMMLARIQTSTKKLGWEWCPSSPNTHCKAVTEKPVKFSVRRPSAVCNNNRMEKVCLCARNKMAADLKEVCGKCDYLLRVQTIDGKPVGGGII
jgi:hypothetical protein